MCRFTIANVNVSYIFMNSWHNNALDHIRDVRIRLCHSRPRLCVSVSARCSARVCAYSNGKTLRNYWITATSKWQQLCRYILNVYLTKNRIRLHENGKFQNILWLKKDIGNMNLMNINYNQVGRSSSRSVNWCTGTIGQRFIWFMLVRVFSSISMSVFELQLKHACKSCK